MTLPTKWSAVERYWFSCQYVTGMASRRGRIAPAIWGPWATADEELWGGGYTLDLNFQTPFQALFSSNRAAGFADSYFAIIEEYARRRGGFEAAAKRLGGCNASGGVDGMPGAVHFTVKITPGGVASSADDAMNNNGLFVSLNFISNFEFSEDVTFLREESYPLLRAVAAWFVLNFAALL